MSGNEIPVDWNRVVELRAEIGEEDFSEVVDLFLEEVDELIDGLMRADPQDVEAHMHALKGSSLNIGFALMAELCRLGEAEAAAGRPHTISPSDVTLCFHHSREAFLAGLGSHQ